MMEQATVKQERRTYQPFYKRFDFFVHLYVILGFTVPALIYIVVMMSLGWRVPSFDANGSLVFSFSYSDKTILYVSQNTKAYFDGVGANYDLLLNPWRDYFENRSKKVAEISTPTQLKELANGVVILPSAVSLSAEERDAFRAFEARGGAILATWATGSRNASGDWTGWKFLEEHGATVVGEIPKESEVNHLVINGESPVSFSVAAGQRVYMSKASESILRIKGENAAARLTNWARVISDEFRGESAVIFSESRPDRGRSVVFAYSESAWANHPQPMYPLFDDVIRWLQREPMAIRAAWPQGMLAANVVEMDTEDKFENALGFDSLLKSAEYPTGYYVLTSVAKRFPAVVETIGRGAEIGFHGDVHVGFKDVPESQQAQRLQTMRKDLVGLVKDPSKVIGFRAPTESYDGVTEKLLVGMGIRHHVADPNRSDARLPLFARVEGSTPDTDLIVLPRTQRDDINLYWERLSVEQTTKAMIDDSELVLENGGLGLLSVHSQNFDAGSVLHQALPPYLNYLKQKRFVIWNATAGQVADWWRDRERFLVRSVFTGKRMSVDVTVIGDNPVRGGTIIISLPQRDILPKVSNTKTTGPTPAVVRLDSYRAAIVFSEALPGNFNYQVTF